MDLISAESLRRPEVVRWHERIVERYFPPNSIGVTVLLPCSAKKPYSKSKSHMTFRGQIRSAAGSKLPRVHEVILTSPLGLVPRELEEVYPAAHYDVPVTGDWSEEEKCIVIKLLKDYMKKSDAPVIGHVEGVYREICEQIDVETTDGNPLKLEEFISSALKRNDVSFSDHEKHKKIQAVCDFQFGKNAQAHLLRGNFIVKGFQVSDENGELIATVDRATGSLALSLEGAERLQSYGRYMVELSFNPDSSNVFCVGIEQADPLIRPRDEVIAIYKGDVVGVGKSLLSGEELEKAYKGLGLTLRHRRKQHG